MPVVQAGGVQCQVQEASNRLVQEGSGTVGVNQGVKQDWVRFNSGSEGFNQGVQQDCVRFNSGSAGVNQALQQDRVVRINPGQKQVSQLVQVEAQSVRVPTKEERLEKIKKSPVFSTGMGSVVGYEAYLELKPEAQPVFRKSRPVPFALKPKICETLERMESDGILQRVDHSKFASPMIAVPKENGDIRICGDYKSTLNPALETKQYPLPCIEDCFAPMSGGQVFTKLDIRQAYNNLCLREEDQVLTTMNTCLGLFKWKRLPYGISSSTAIFQQTMDQVLQNLDGCVCRVDDILVTGRTEDEHLTTLEEVVRRLETAGFRCNLSKTRFLQDEVTYLGYRINRSGYRPAESKVDTLLRAPYPSNLTQLVSFLSAVNYYARFMRNLSTVAEPLNRLRRQGEKWKFGKVEQAAFDQLKKQLTSTAVLIPYDPDLPVKVDTDASTVGIGAVISHVLPDGTERPIEMASRTLTKSEKNYAQIEKEALSLVWGIQKFHRYVFARKFTLVTDHKPLIYILKENKQIPDMATSRITRWAIILSAYQYQISYRPTEKHSNADVLSRFPLECTEKEDTQVADVLFNSFVDKPLINFETIRKFTHTDVTLSKVRRFIRSGWPERWTGSSEEEVKPYIQRRTELSVEYDCVMWADRVVVPTKLRKDVLEMLHVAHQGVVAMKALARSFVWWPGVNEQI